LERPPRNAKLPTEKKVSATPTQTAFGAPAPLFQAAASPSQMLPSSHPPSSNVILSKKMKDALKKNSMPQDQDITERETVLLTTGPNS
jgi:hypothetical protein